MRIALRHRSIDVPSDCLDRLFRDPGILKQRGNAVMSEVIHAEPGQFRRGGHTEPCGLEAGLVTRRIEKGLVDAEGKQEVIRSGRTELGRSFYGELSGLVGFVIKGDRSYSASVLGARWLNVDERLILVFNIHVLQPEGKNFLRAGTRVY